MRRHLRQIPYRRALRNLVVGSVAIAAVAYLWAAPGQQTEGVPQTLTFSVQSQMVQVFFTVTQGTRRILNLKPDDVTLTEDGKAVRFDRLDSETVPLQIALLFDVSESMRNALGVTQAAATSFVKSLEPGDRTTLVFFNSDVRCVPQRTDDREPILRAIRNAQAQGATKLYESLLFAMKYLNGKTGRKAIVAFSDGEDTARASSLNIVLNAAARYGFPIYTIGAGEGLTRNSLRTILRQLAAVNGGKAFFVEDPRRLQDAFAEVSSELRSGYVLNYYTQVPFDGRWHDIQIALGTQGYKVHSRRGFFARTAATGDPDEPPAELARAIVVEHSAAHDRIEGPVAERAAASARTEISSPPAPLRSIPQPETALDPAILSPAANQPQAETPVFKVETRFVEVPVLIESISGKEPQDLSEKDFRIYEDENLREVAFFARTGHDRDMTQLRSAALEHLQAVGASRPSLAPGAKDDLLLGRYYVLIDDTMSETGAFLRAKQAAEQIIRGYYNPLRPISLHLTSDMQLDLGAQETLDSMLGRLRRANQRAHPELTSNNNLISIHEAYLIERGDRQAEQLAELRYAANLHVTYKNELGEVQGDQPVTPDMIRSTVDNDTRALLSENFSQVSRAIEGLKTAVSGLASYPGQYPRVIIFFSSGFVLGRGSGRADMAQALEDTIALARRSGVRVFTIDAGGLAPTESLGLGVGTAFLVQNPHLDSILQEHARGWQNDRESSLAEIAQGTGGRFLHNTNDLPAVAASVMRTTGQVYYLGYLSKQPEDGKFHRIRVTSSLSPGVRLYTRQGYIAGQQANSEAGPDNEGVRETAETLVLKVNQARASGNMELVAGSLEKLSRKLPSQPNIWFNLGSARLNMDDARGAVEAYQKAHLLAPEDKGISVQLSRAFALAGDRESAAQVLEELTRRNPDDVQSLIQLGRVYETDSRVADAYEAYRRVLDLMLGPPLDVYLLLARTSMSLGRQIEADLFIQDYLGRGGEPQSIQPYRAVAQAR